MKKVFSLLLVILLSNWAVAQITDYSMALAGAICLLIFHKKYE